MTDKPPVYPRTLVCLSDHRALIYEELNLPTRTRASRALKGKSVFLRICFNSELDIDILIFYYKLHCRVPQLRILCDIHYLNYILMYTHNCQHYHSIQTYLPPSTTLYMLYIDCNNREHHGSF
jgi:hypothetical protein